MFERIWFYAILLIVVFGFQNRVLAAGSWVDGSAANGAGDARNYKLWLPEGYQSSAPLPLVMMLHGCSQNPNDFAAGTEMNQIADQYKFLVVYPEQPSSANGTNCWNWFLPEHQTRGAGEPAILAAIVQKIQAQHAVRHNQVFVAGMSAGAAMSVIMAATYPDIFAAVGASAGLEYKAANDLISGLIAQETGGPDPNLQGEIAFSEMGAQARRMRTIVFHGTIDPTVNSANGAQIIAQWAQTNDFVDDAADNDSVNSVADETLTGTASVANGLTYTRRIYNDGGGVPLMEFWLVDLMRHSWSGGSSAGSYTEPRGPKASFEMARFFGLTASPTAAAASISGRVVSVSGRGLPNIVIVLAGGNLNERRYARTNSFGYYHFTDVTTGASYILSVASKRYVFASPTVSLNLLGDFEEANFIAAP
jgi:poly(hydroxyalkanoate) depolymerase family esterase